MRRCCADHPDENKMHFSWKGEMCQNSIHDVQHSPLTKKVSGRAMVLIICWWKQYMSKSWQITYFPNKTWWWTSESLSRRKWQFLWALKITEPHHGDIRRINQLHEDPNCWLEQLHLSFCTDIVHFCLSIWVIRYLKWLQIFQDKDPFITGKLSWT